MIRQLTMAELTYEFGTDDAKLMFKEGQVWARIDPYSMEIVGDVYRTRLDAELGNSTGANHD